MDDITLTVEACTIGDAAATLRSDLGEVESSLRADNMQLSDAKEQVYGVTQADREAWEATGGTAEVAQAPEGAPLWGLRHCIMKSSP